MEITKEQGRIKICQADRSLILTTIMEKNFKTETDDHVSKLLSKYSLKYYRRLVPAALEKKLRSLPDGWVKYVSSIDILIPGWYERRAQFPKTEKIKSNTSPDGFYLEVKPRPWPYKAREAFSLEELEVNDSDPIVSPVIEELNRIDKAREATMSAKAAARDLLFSCKTLNQLNQKWPEAMEYVPQYLLEPPSYLPSMKVSTVNEMLGIKVNSK